MKGASLTAAGQLRFRTGFPNTCRLFQRRTNPPRLWLLKKPPKGLLPLNQECSPSFRRKPESILRLLPFARVPAHRRGNETPTRIHPHPQMDSGFRRNDEPNRIRLILSSGEAAYRRMPSRHGASPPPFDTPPSAATQGEERGVGGFQESHASFFNNPLKWGVLSPPSPVGCIRRITKESLSQQLPLMTKEQARVRVGHALRMLSSIRGVKMHRIPPTSRSART